VTQNITLITAETNELGFVAAGIFTALLAQCDTPLPLVTLPTGKTPESFYAALLAHGTVAPFRYLQLDEYVGLDKHDPRLFSSWLDRDILTPLGITHDQRFLFRSDAIDPQTEVNLMKQRLLTAGSIDIAVLGLGLNGHIAFNEPQSVPINDDVYITGLTAETRLTNAAYWHCPVDHMPTHGYTLGIPLLSRAKHTILLVTGKDKADILEKTLKSPVSFRIPSTYLQNTRNVTIIADNMAARQLADYKLSR